MDFAKLVEDALEDRGNAVVVIANPASGEHAVIKTANGSFGRMVGYQPRRLDGLPLGALRGWIKSDSDWASLITAVSTLTPLHRDIKLKVRERDTWFEFGVTFKTDTVDGAAHGIIIGRDITQARRRSLQDNGSQRLLASVFLRTSASVLIVRFNGTILMTNPAAQHLLGYGAEELLGIDVATLCRGEFARIAAAARAKQLRDGEAYELSIETIAKSGEAIRVRLTSVLMGETDDHGLRLVTLIPEVTPPDAFTVGAYPAAPAVTDVAACSIGQVNAISLMAFKIAFGEVWQRVAPRAMMMTEKIIKRHLAAVDVFSRLDDHGFVIWFDGSDVEHNAAVLAAVGQEIRLKFLAEFSAEMTTYISALVVGATAADPGDGTLLPSQAVLDHLREERHVARMEAAAVLQELRDPASSDVQIVTGRDRKATSIVMVDYTPTMRGRVAALPLLGLDGAMEQEVELRRLDVAMRQLNLRRSGNVLVPISWLSLSAPDRRGLFNQRIGRMEASTRSRLILAVSGVPPFQTAQHWTEIVRPLEGVIASVGLVTVLKKGDLVSTQAAVVSGWPLSLLVIDATEAASLPPHQYYDITVAARYRNIPVLVRMAGPGDLRDWHELGATMFVGTA